MTAENSYRRSMFLLYRHSKTITGTKTGKNYFLIAKMYTGMYSTTRVVKCVVGVALSFGGLVALPLDVRELIKMVIDVVAWTHTVLAL